MSLGLRAACEEVHRKLNLAPRRLPEVSNMRRVAADTAGAGNGLQAPGKVDDWNAIAGRLFARLEDGARLSPAELRKAAWCLWRTDPALAESSKILSAVLGQMSEAGNRRPFRAFASSFVSSFAEERAAVGMVGRVLAEQTGRWGPPWQQLQEEYSFFHPVEGPRHIARAVLAEGGSVVDVLRKRGLGAVAAEGGYAKAVTAALLMELAGGASLDHAARLARVQTLALRPDGALLFEDQAVLVAEALLRPFKDGDPDTLTQDRFLQTVLGLFKDPRLHPGLWHRMDDLADLVCRWLTRQSLRQFLDIVDQTADRYMWKYRRAFWGAVHDAGLLSGAWVVLGPDGATRARRAFGKDVSFAQFGWGGGKQVESGHAVLLMRIGRGVVADWSHNGKCNIWSDAETSAAPRLYKERYDSDEVRIIGVQGNLQTDDLFSIMHMSSENYNWQNKVAEKIYRMTGYRLQQAAYKVR